MRTLWRGLMRIVFWSYERGSWPYDAMVVAIVVFVLATPRAWFHDQPRSSSLASSSLPAQEPVVTAHVNTYRLDAALLPSDKPSARMTPEMERRTHDILERTVPELKGQAFQVVQVDPVRASDGTLLYYQVSVHR